MHLVVHPSWASHNKPADFGAGMYIKLTKCSSWEMCIKFCKYHLHRHHFYSWKGQTEYDNSCIRIGNVPRAKANLSLWDFMLFDDFIVPSCRSLPACTLKVVFNGPLSLDSSLRPTISMPGTWRCISAPLHGCRSMRCSGKDGPCGWWGQQHETLRGWSVQDMPSHQLRLLDQKGQTSLFSLEVMVKFTVTLMGLNFHPTNVLEVTISSCMCPFFHTKTLKPDSSWEASNSYIRLFLNHNLQILLLTPDRISFFGWG